MSLQLFLGAFWGGKVVKVSLQMVRKSPHWLQAVSEIWWPWSTLDVGAACLEMSRCLIYRNVGPFSLTLPYKSLMEAARPEAGPLRWPKWIQCETPFALKKKAAYKCCIWKIVYRTQFVITHATYVSLYSPVTTDRWETLRWYKTDFIWCVCTYQRAPVVPWMGGVPRRRKGALFNGGLVKPAFCGRLLQNKQEQSFIFSVAIRAA